MGFERGIGGRGSIGGPRGLGKRKGGLGHKLSLVKSASRRRLGSAPAAVTSKLTTNAGLWMSDMSLITTTVSADDTTNFSVYVTPMPSSAGRGRIYIAVEATASPTFNNDVCIGAVQIASNNGTTLDHNFRMHEDGNTWQYASANTVGDDTISDISGYSWTNIANTTTSGRFNRFSSTGSSKTGAADGLDLASDYNIFSENSLSDGNNNAVVAQSSSHHFIYSETSSVSNNAVIWTRSPEITLDDQDTGAKLVVAYHACSSSTSSMQNTEDEHLMTLFWVEV